MSKAEHLLACQVWDIRRVQGEWDIGESGISGRVQGELDNRESAGRVGYQKSAGRGDDAQVITTLTQFMSY